MPKLRAVTRAALVLRALCSPPTHATLVWQLLLAKRLARDYPEVACVSAHPGWVQTDGLALASAQHGRSASFSGPTLEDLQSPLRK